MVVVPAQARLALQHRLVEVWTWLPAFRAVAELEHVHRAAERLHVTPSSLSRAIRLLEEHLGRKLFERVGRNVRLNHDGAELLACLRDAMRTIDDGMARVTATVFAGELRVACEGDHPIAFAWRAAARLHERHPGLRTTVEPIATKRSLVPRLLRGELDVAIVTSIAGASERLLVEHLGDLTYGIYCGVGHPLHERRRPTMQAICEHPFVAPTATGEDGPDDQWPKDLARIVSLRLPALQPAIAVCASGELLAVLPDLAVSEAADRVRLRRLPSDGVPPSPVLVISRRPTRDVDRAKAFIDELRAGVRDSLRKSARPESRAPSLRGEAGSARRKARHVR